VTNRFIRRKGLWLSLFFGALGAWLGPIVGIPGGAFTGAMIVSGLANLRLGTLQNAPAWMQLLARVLLGLSIGVSVTAETIAAVGRSLAPVSLMVVAVALVGVLAAWAINRRTGMKLPTALCAAAPGALPAMVALADDLGGEAPVVATMHLIRLVSILLIIPALVSTVLAPNVAGAVVVAPVAVVEAAPALPPLLGVAILVAAGMAASVLAIRARIPAGDLLGPMVVAAVLNPAWLHVVYPEGLRLVSNWILGLGVGASINTVTLRRFRPYALAGTLMTTFLIVSGLALGWLLTVMTDIDLLTAVIGCAPGGATGLIALAGELGADSQVVAAMHVSRMIILLAILPFIIRAAARRLDRSGAATPVPSNPG
jgi:membrane AbrB-like protein